MRTFRVITGLLGLAVGCWGGCNSPESAKAPNDVAAHATHTSPNQTSAEVLVSTNTDAAEYLGAKSCVECHTKQFQTYRDTPHARSFETTVPSQEPEGDSFRHARSHRKYLVASNNNQLMHREDLLASDNSVISSTEMPISYTVGSGIHAKTYLVRHEGILFESPVSWYREGGWKMSPGYEHSAQDGFSRAITSDCIFCHVGNIDRLDENPYRFEITESTIGCERCHGPGSLHVAKHTEGGDAAHPETIIHPEKLDRELSEAICQQCHLQGAISVEGSEHSAWDFRPGQEMTKYRSDYQTKITERPMKIVGHVEQMHESECYQQTESLTCITCHDPHHMPLPADRVDYFRQQCLECHADEDCGADAEHRMQVAANDCVECHMPAKATNVSHVAFHDHRIGIHAASKGTDINDSKARTQATEIVPIIRGESLPQVEKQRREGLALYRLFERGGPEVNAKVFREKATELLVKLYHEGKADADVSATLALDAQSLGYVEIAEELAEYSIKKTDQPTSAMINARRVLGQIAFDRGSNDIAISHFRFVADNQPNSASYYHLALAEQNAGNTEIAVDLLRRAIAIDPMMVSARQALGAILSSIGKQEEASQEMEKINQIDAL